ncbi:MAG TPA: DUF4386 domain-containing protein [Candidatus Dormibacteraeota bacterium]|nr:DUF4386 domain-containing protein [Candidatus Dormibacteraeota bacterium]
MTSPKVVARVAGSLYLFGSVCFVLAMEVRSGILNASGTAGAADNVRSSAFLFRASLAADLVSWTCALLTGMALYVLLNNVHRMAAAAMMVFVVVEVAVGYLNDVNQYAALTIATSAPSAKAFGADGSNALVMLAAQTQHNGLLINEMFFGLWLLPLGYLVIKSRHFPRLVGLLLIVAAVDWIAQFFADLLVPSLPAYVFAVEQIGGVGELVFVAWLLIFAVRLPAVGASASAMVTTLGRD